MAAIGKRGQKHGLVPDRTELATQIVRQIVALQRRRGDLEDADRAVGAFHGEAAGGEFQILKSRFQHVARDPQPLRDDRRSTRSA